MLKSLFLKVLSPWVRQSIKHNVSCSEFCEIVKKSYVDQSFECFALPNKKMTVSRVAALTGLSRKEVVRLAEDDKAVTKPKIVLNSATRVTMRWLSDSLFLDGQGEPKVLPIKEGDSSFVGLVDRAGGDVPPMAVLTELLRLGIVSQEQDDYVRLVNRGYIPNKSEIEKLDILATCAKDLLTTGLHNLETENRDQARFQRQLIQHVPEDVAEEFKQFSEKKSQDLLIEFNQWLREKQRDRNYSNEGKLKPIGVGIYYIEE